MLNAKAEQLKARSKRFAVRIVDLYRQLPRTEEARVLGRQLLRSATSVAANSRAACRGRSRAEFLSKLGDAQKELEETIYWMELLVDSGTFPPAKMLLLQKESAELMSIFSASIKTARFSRS